MLELLRIKDLALIEDAELEFAPGMNVLTGETGAGKSFILRAIDFLTGERMSSDMVRPGKDKASVEALFLLSGGETVIRREISAESGRSRVFVNDKLGSQELIRTLKPGMVVHTSQHGQQKLLQPALQSAILDSFIPDRSIVLERNHSLDKLKDILVRKEDLRQKTEILSQQRELLEFQRTEIDKVSPQAGEEEELERNKVLLKEQEQTSESLGAALDVILSENGLNSCLNQLSRSMELASRLHPSLESDYQAVEEFRLRVTEIEEHLRRAPDTQHVEGDLDSIESRLFEFSRLKRALKRDMNQILGLQKEISENLSFLDSCGLELQRLEKQETAEALVLGKALEKLNIARQQTAENLCTRLEDELKDLGFSEHVRIEFRFDATEPYPGLEELKGRLMWIPNPGQPPQPLDKIASGGELSRFLLALAGLRGGTRADGHGLPTLLFDEVDAGVGGLTLNSLGNKLAQLAGRQQVLLISHWPQLAALADRHFFISKDVSDGETFTSCRRLDDPAIREELARMAGGGEKGEALAAELVKKG